MIIQLVDIFYPNVFKKYSVKFNIFRDLHEKDLLGLELREINSKLANRIKKIVLSNKEICYVNPNKSTNTVDLLALGSYGIFKAIAKEIIAIGNEDIGFKITKVIQNVTEYDSTSFRISGLNYLLNKAYIMGILNVTPDSFSDGGKFISKEAAISHGIHLIEQGADFLDVGGESTRPGSEPLNEDEELKRIIPVIEAIIRQKPNAIISIDTRKSKVAKESLIRGAKIINDISSGSDPEMFEIAKEHNAAMVLMHMKGNPSKMQDAPYYDDVVSEIYDYMIAKKEIAERAGVKNIIIDPGIGFGKRVFDNYELIKRLNEFKGIGCPILIGLSKKSFLGKALNLKIDEREEATLAAEVLAIKNGARIIRTHDVKKAIFASRINEFIENPESLINV